MLTGKEAAERLNTHKQPVARWAKHGIITRHAYNGHYALYELPAADLPQKQCSRWNRLVDRAAQAKDTAHQNDMLEKEGT